MIDIEKNPLLREAVRAACEILSELTKQRAFSNDDASMLISISQRLNTKQIQAPMQPLHGDANFSNVLNTTCGVLWQIGKIHLLGQLLGT